MGLVQRWSSIRSKSSIVQNLFERLKRTFEPFHLLQDCTSLPAFQLLQKESSLVSRDFWQTCCLTWVDPVDMPAVMLILSNEEIESFLSIATCIDALEKAYKSWDKGTAINRPRTDLVLPSPNESGVYAFKSMEADPDPPIVAMRINSDIIRWRQQGGRVLKTKVPAAPGD